MRKLDEETISRLTDNGGVIVNPSTQIVEQISSEELDDITLVLSTDVSTELKNNFMTLTNIQEQIESNDISVLVGADTTGSFFLSGDMAGSIVSTTDMTTVVPTTDAEVREALIEQVEIEIDQSVPFDSEVPSISVITDTAEEHVSPEFSETLRAALESADQPFSEVNLVLLAAAKNDELLYDVSEWCEMLGIASKATCSRAKTSLEESKLLETERVPIDVGRPRLRLSQTPEIETVAASELVQKLN